MKRFLVAVCALGLWAQPSSAETLRIYHIDVEQGAATLFVAPGGRTLLFDSGKNGHGSRIQAVMKQAGVSQIDLFVNSHYHEDHFGGIDDLVDLQVPVLEAYDRGDHQFVPAANKKQPTWQGCGLQGVGVRPRSSFSPIRHLGDPSNGVDRWLLTCFHVLARSNGTLVATDRIFQPSGATGIIATLAGTARLPPGGCRRFGGRVGRGHYARPVALHRRESAVGPHLAFAADLAVVLTALQHL
jgi:metallo-beta-lactamase superfamily protein